GAGGNALEQLAFHAVRPGAAAAGAADAALLARRGLAHGVLGRLRPPHGRRCSRAARRGCVARRPRAAGQRKPAGVEHRRRGADGGRRRDGADLQHQPPRRPRPRPARRRRPRGGRLHPRPRRQGAGRRRRGGRAGHADLHGRRPGGPGGNAHPRMVRAGSGAGRPAHADGGGGADTGRPPRLPHLHVRHRRLAQGGDAAAPRHAGEPRRLGHGAGAPVARRHALPLLLAAVPLLRAHGRLLPPALAWHGGGVFARRRALGGRDGGGAAHHPHRRAPAVRGAARPDAGADREGGRPQAPPVRARPRPRAPPPGRPAAGPRRTRAGRRARPRGAPQGPGALRRPAGRHGVRRRPARPRPVRLLLGARPAGAPGLRPERGGARHQRQPALEQRPPHGGRAAPRRRNPHRSGRRDTGPRRPGDGRLLERRGSDEPRLGGVRAGRGALAPHRRRRPLGRWPPRRHRPQARLHQDARRRHGEPGQDRRPADGRARDRPGGRRRRGPTRDRGHHRPGRGHGSRPRRRGEARERPLVGLRARPPLAARAALLRGERLADAHHEGEAPLGDRALRAGDRVVGAV
ncbi:MAG: Long-chain-fatty-acid--CoA ligase, partial [uncultured Acetobacteraceae bacterium]